MYVRNVEMNIFSIYAKFAVGKVLQNAFSSAPCFIRNQFLWSSESVVCIIALDAFLICVQKTYAGAVWT
jgi:hypothetical protein